MEILKPVYATGRGRMFDNGIGSIIENAYKHLYDLRNNLWLPAEVRDEITLGLMKLKPVMGGTASNAAETDILELIFQAVAWPDLAQDDGSGPATNISVALHTADPGEGGTQSTSEAAYGSYARVNVVRTSSGWAVSSGSATPVANITFPTSSGSGSTITHFSVGSGVSNYMIASGSISPTIPVGGSGVTPILTTSTAITCD